MPLRPRKKNKKTQLSEICRSDDMDHGSMFFSPRHSAVTQRSKSSKAILADLSSFSLENLQPFFYKVFPINWGGAGFKFPQQFK